MLRALVGGCNEALRFARGRQCSEYAHFPETKRRQSGVANIKSQIKRIRTNEQARLRNKSVKSALKTAVRRVKAAAASGDKVAAQTELVTAARSLDKAASKGVIHANQAANRKSALAKQVDAL